MSLCSVNFAVFSSKKKMNGVVYAIVLKSKLCTKISTHTTITIDAITSLQGNGKDDQGREKARKKERQRERQRRRMKRKEWNNDLLYSRVAIQNKMLFLSTLLLNKPQTHPNISSAHKTNRHSPQPHKIMFNFSLYMATMFWMTLFIQFGHLMCGDTHVGFEDENCSVCGLMPKQSNDTTYIHHTQWTFTCYCFTPHLEEKMESGSEREREVEWKCQEDTEKNARYIFREKKANKALFIGPETVFSFWILRMLLQFFAQNKDFL